ncbi:MAG: hypothetical protein NTZ90_06410 [Proteobacteria bacterium]|nr:hypothetical protein [Pseudomonadota bacterium]
MNYRHRLALIAAVFALDATACKTPNQNSTAQSIGIPDSEGVPVTFLNNDVARVMHELFQVMPNLAKASNPSGVINEIQVLSESIRCEQVNAKENRCRFTYSGPELSTKFVEVFFQTMAGYVSIRKGCADAATCTQPPAAIWWRTLARDNGTGPKQWDFEVCRINGVLATVGSGERFRFLDQFLSTVGYIPQLHGFKVTVEQTERDAPKLNPDDTPQLDSSGKPVMEKIPDFKPVSGVAGLGPLGPFPTQSCALSDDPKESPASGPLAAIKGALGGLPGPLLSKVPAPLVKTLIDTTQLLGDKFSGENLKMTLRCRNSPNRPACHLSYIGPEITVPSERNITGTQNKEIVILRGCKNPGCKQYTEAMIDMTSYTKDNIEIVEFCSMQGFEIATRKNIPFQGTVFGIPDFVGMIARVKVNASNDPLADADPILQSLKLGISRLGNYPTHNCNI